MAVQAAILLDLIAQAKELQRKTSELIQTLRQRIENTRRVLSERNTRFTPTAELRRHRRPPLDR